VNADPCNYGVGLRDKGLGVPGLGCRVGG